MQSKGKIKTLIGFAIILIVGLLVLSGYLLLKINEKKKELKIQREQIEKLENQVDGYLNKDNKNGDIEINITEEE